MENMLIGPELLEARAFIDGIVMTDGKTTLICTSENGAHQAVGAIQRYFDADERCYAYEIRDKVVELTLL